VIPGERSSNNNGVGSGGLDNRGAKKGESGDRHNRPGAAGERVCCKSKWARQPLGKGDRGGFATTFAEHKEGFDARGLETGFGVSLLMERAKHSLDSRAKPGGIHGIAIIGAGSVGATLGRAWLNHGEGRDLGSTLRRSETSVAAQGACQSASRSGQGGGGRGDRNPLVRGRGGNSLGSLNGKIVIDGMNPLGMGRDDKKARLPKQWLRFDRGF
jgi:hypothetical protein